MTRKFRNDKQRKAVFANIFNRNGSKSKVSPINVKNFEVSTKKMKGTKLPKFKAEKVHFQDIKAKSLRAHCDMCKRKGLSLKKGRCKICSVESKKFKQPKLKSLDLTPDLREALDFFITTEEGLDDEIRQTRLNLEGEEDDDAVQDLLSNMAMLRERVLRKDRLVTIYLNQGEIKKMLTALNDLFTTYDAFSPDDFDFKDIVYLNMDREKADIVLDELKSLFEAHDLPKPYWIHW